MHTETPSNLVAHPDHNLTGFYDLYLLFKMFLYVHAPVSHLSYISIEGVHVLTVFSVLNTYEASEYTVSQKISSRQQ